MNKLVVDLKQALAFSVGIGNSLVLLYIFMNIFIYKRVIVEEPILSILVTEIALTVIGTFYLWKIFKLNHNDMVMR